MSLVRPRSGLGQASSNDAGGGSAGSTGGGASAGFGRISADSISGGNGSLVRDCARSRSFREVEENSKLRLGLSGGAASARSGPPRARSPPHRRRRRRSAPP